MKHTQNPRQIFNITGNNNTLLYNIRFEIPRLWYVKYDILLKDVGVEGQEKIRQGKVLIIGAGGLGTPVALYLAAAGVGTIGISPS